MDQEKQIFNLAPGTNEVIIRQGKAPKVLDETAPKQYDVAGQINSVSEYLSKRISTKQFEQKDCTIIVNREHEFVCLTFNERDERNCGTVSGQLTRCEDFKLLNLNGEKLWKPEELAMLFKMHRYWFAERKECMDIVSLLLNYKADIKQKVERAMQENGSRAYNFAQEVNSNLPPKVTLMLSVFKGQQPQVIEVETFARVDGENVTFALLSPGANEIVNTYRDIAIDEEIKRIKAVAPEIVIIEQ